MDYKKLLNVSVSPGADFEGFFSQIEAKVESAKTYKLQNHIISMALEYFNMDMPHLKHDDYKGSSLRWEQGDRFLKLITFYRNKTVLEHDGLQLAGSIYYEEDNIGNTGMAQKLIWKGDDTELLELTYALIYSGLVVGKNDSEVRETIASYFGIKLKAPDTRLAQMGTRQSENEDITPFFKKLNGGWKKYNVEKMSKRRKRK